MAEILLLGADKSQTSGIASLLRQDRHAVRVLRDLARWRDAESTLELDLIVAAIRPSEQIFAAPGPRVRGFATPILIVQQDPDFPAAAHRDERLVDRIATPFTAEELLARVDALIRVRRTVRKVRTESLYFGDACDPSLASQGFLQGLGSRISSLLGARVTAFARPEAPYAGVATRVAAWMDRRDAFVPGHAERVATFAALIADGIGLSDDETTTLVRAAVLHDIGKAAVPIEILRQRGPLAENKKRIIQTHAERGASILCALNTEESIVEAIRYHHERFDGQGHLRRGGNDTPRSARILAVAEVYDAMTSTLVVPVRKQDEALKEMLALRGGQLDPECVDALIEALTPRASKIRVAAPRS